MQLPVVKRRRMRSRALPALTLVCGLALTYGGWWVTTQQVRLAEEERFERLTEKVVSTVKERFASAAQAVYSARAVLAHSQIMTRTEWSRYVRNVEPVFSPGVVGLGLAERVRAADVDTLEKQMRVEGQPDFTVQRSEGRDWLYVVTRIEPLEKNTGVLGLDLGFKPYRRAIADLAAQTNAPALTKKMRVLYQGKEVPGFLLLLPLYAPDAPLTTPQQRAAAVTGWVYAALRLDSLLQGVVESTERKLDLEVFEGTEATLDNLMFDSDGHLLAGTQPRVVNDKDFPGRMFRSAVPLSIHGRRWTLMVSSFPGFQTQSSRLLPWVVAWAGSLGSFLGALLMWGQVNGRARALDLADRRTADLSRAEAEARRLALVASRTMTAVVLTDPEWKIEWTNDSFTRYFGYTPAETKGRRPSELLYGPETSAAALAAIKQACQEGRLHRGEMLLHAREGRKLWVEIETQPLQDAAGRLAGFMGLLLDITERKRVEAEIVRRESLFRFLLDALPMGVTWKFLGEQNVDEEYVSEGVLRITGLTREQCSQPDIYQKITDPD
ncbi:MAG: CHASE domain-containing protein, partial [Opitutales bacterium]